ncbi:putative DNA-directed RNA polymerase II 13.6 kDa polypeptide [Tribonema minus]|uniref:Putative DNA-directed RNA polymerase II 13.6 kDa polypeptide n=1 Tax=Tribonema minus TaxID=303371 RepID=A0A836CIX8_9STRA|nr:putative DNA-directed RNA polymerase II 13.6 kDa polypeptide [Tribonema minus]|eukprot:TRINITY_DN8546_c0_g1_i2.p1 TRINITY_DN8546_c0_g1~~TRINITY_DN8546_c0_g1_i2.p1  ORF type:complete len:123 (+),score=54.10 TRINITY_DN8546_c0_g1_i2:123-491(+)
MNAPERSESWRLNEGEEKVDYEPDTKIPNAGNFIIKKEDHTLGNLIRMQLLQDRQVRFAGYLMPHPLENIMRVKVQTNGEVTPMDALSTAIEDLTSEVDNLTQRFAEGVLACKRLQESRQYQ